MLYKALYVLSLCVTFNSAFSFQVFLKRVLLSNTLLSLDQSSILSEKQIRLPPTEIAKVVAEDIELRQALNTADLTRSIYSEECHFQDEIDIYPIEDYVKGTKALFKADKSHTNLLRPVIVSEDGKSILATFEETLTFNIPFNPAVHLSGSLTLDLDEDGLIRYSRERWDQSVPEVLLSVKFSWN